MTLQPPPPSPFTLFNVILLAANLLLFFRNIEHIDRMEKNKT